MKPGDIIWWHTYKFGRIKCRVLRLHPDGIDCDVELLQTVRDDYYKGRVFTLNTELLTYDGGADHE